MTRILFIGTLHHPETLIADKAKAHANNEPEPLFPSSMSLRFWEKALRKQGAEMQVFWRNLPSFGAGDISALEAEKYTERITPQRVFNAVMARLPYDVNIEVRRRNANLLKQARAFQPDIVWLIGDNRIVHKDTLAQLKQELGCKIFYYSGVSPIIFAHAMEKEAAPLYDLAIVNDYYHGIQWRELGAPHMICLPTTAIDPEFHCPYDLTAQEEQEYACDISFVGTLLPANLYSERVDALSALSEFNLGIWSVHDVPQVLKPYYRGSALGQQMMRVMSAAPISLNVHGNFMRYGGNMRLFESVGVGAFQIVDDRPGVREWFTPDEHLVIFTDYDDLRQKVGYYLNHPDERIAIAKAAREHALQHHTYDHRLQTLMQHPVWGN